MNSIFLLLALCWLTPAFGISTEVMDLVHNETKSNAVAVRSEDMIPIQHYEIPIESVVTDFSDRFPPNIRESLIFKKNDREYVRWIINPEDRKWHQELKKYLQEKGLDSQPHQFFNGYQTASRSYIVENPKNGAQFSLKVSTDHTGGHWKDKKQTAVDAIDVRRATDFVIQSAREKPFENFLILDEPAAMALPGIDQGMLVRELTHLPDSNNYYLPGFSAVHTRAGKAIAEINSSLDPASFWDQHYNKPLARALAELAARTGVAYDSPHSQNFLVELDSGFQPTGRIILRDLGDIFLTKEIVEAAGGAELVKRWPATHVLKGSLQAGMGLLHGNEFPAWLDEEAYKKWGINFFREYEKELSRWTGIPAFPTGIRQNVRYFSKGYKVTGAEWQPYLERLRNSRLPGRAVILRVDCATSFRLLNSDPAAANP